MSVTKLDTNMLDWSLRPSVIQTVKLFLLVLLFTTISCSTDDDDGEEVQNISTPTISYASTTIEAEFSTPGNSSAPTVNWNGEQGSFSLVNTVPGVNINSTTGVVSWNRLLPLGTTNLQLIASNSAGQTGVNLTINTPLRGVFTGTYDNSVFFQFEFMTDGTAIVNANSSSSPDVASGTYTISNDEILVNYTYEGDSQFYSILGTLTQTETGAGLSGNWYYAADADPSEVGGLLELSL